MVMRILLAALLMAAGTPAVATAQPATPARVATRINDIDGDGRVDIVFVTGSRDAASPSGQPRVQVRLATGKVQSVSATELGDDLFEDSVFGSGLAVGDLNADGYADIVVADASAWPSYSGRIWALWGSAGGISAKRATVLARGREGESIGRAVAFARLPEPVLAVAGIYSRVGAVTLYQVTDSGRLGASRRIRPGSPGIVGVASEEVGFGEAMSASGDLLVLGATNASAGGAAYVLQLEPGLRYWATRVVQGSRGVPGTQERFDDFGVAVSVLGDQVAIGVMEGVGRHESAGAIQPLRVERAGHGLKLHPGRLITQAGTAVPGTLGDNHNFGLELAVTKLCKGVWGVLTRERRTSPLTVPFTAASRCPGVWLDQPTPSTHRLNRTRSSGPTSASCVTIRPVRPQSRGSTGCRAGRSRSAVPAPGRWWTPGFRPAST